MAALSLKGTRVHLHRSTVSRQGARAKIMARARGTENDQVIAGMIASWKTGHGFLPRWMGLPPHYFRRVVGHHFPGTGMVAGVRSTQIQDASRVDEIEDLRKLLINNRAGRCRSEIWVADLVCNACLGSNHLWEDMGLWSRKELSALMMRNFPRLAKQNVKDMKWKKFLYKTMCEGTGVYVCRSPSCEVCADYDVCFGPED